MGDGERGVLDKLIDFGAATDWITPVVAAFRNVATDGRSFALTRDQYDALADALAFYRVKTWGTQIHWYAGEYWVTFSTDQAGASRIESLLGAQGNGRGKAIAFLLIALCVGAILVTVAGGAVALLTK